MRSVLLSSGKRVTVHIPITIAGDWLEDELRRVMVTLSSSPDVTDNDISIMWGFVSEALGITEFSDDDATNVFAAFVSEWGTLPARPHRRHMEALFRLHNVTDLDAIDSDVAVAMESLLEAKGEISYRVLCDRIRKSRPGNGDEIILREGVKPNATPEMKRKYEELMQRIAAMGETHVLPS